MKRRKYIWSLWLSAIAVYVYGQYSILVGSIHFAPAIPVSSFLSTDESFLPNRSLPRILAIVFPQYHRDPINDKLWGEGFTDWDNLRAAPEMNRLGLKIPRPIDPQLGYYDYTNSSVRKRQGELAREYGIDGFVFHHYWFYDPDHPGPNLHAPLMKMLDDGYPNISFCFNWCQAPWVDTWLGKSPNTTRREKRRRRTVLQRQHFPDPSDESVKQHYQWLSRFFHHPNYIKVNGQPVFMVYWWLPDNVPILKELRRLAIQDGFPGLYLTIAMSHTHDELFVPGRDKGQDRNQFPTGLVNKTVAYPYPLKWMEKQILRVPEWCHTKTTLPDRNRTDLITGILAAFDNTPRRTLEEAHLWSADEPELVVERFFKSLQAAIYYETCCFPPTTSDDRFILINSMNEWAEGMSLEPSDVFGYRFLESVRKAKTSVVSSGCAIEPPLSSS